jgi:hypothetical protein
LRCGAGFGTIDTMRILRSVPPLILRTLASGAAGIVLVVLGWKALGQPDAGSVLMAFPLMSIGATLIMVALGVAGLAGSPVRRGESL